MTTSVTLPVTARQAISYVARNHVNYRPAYDLRMSQYKKTYIREWRERRGLSLRKLANRIESTPGGEPLVSYASLSRIESGIQPYSQPIIEALAAALGVTVPMLLECDPSAQGEIVDILQKLTPTKRRQAVAILEALAKAS